MFKMCISLKFPLLSRVTNRHPCNELICRVNELLHVNCCHFTVNDNLRQDLLTLIVVIAAMYYGVWYLAINNIPEFIRAIPGSEFISIWWLYIAIVYAVAVVVMLIITKSIAVIQKSKLVGLRYIDGDLMILQGNNRYKMSGYYLMKAKLHGIVACTHMDEEDDAAGKTVVTIRSELSTAGVGQNVSRMPFPEISIRQIRAAL